MVEHLCALFCTVLERWLPVLEFDYVSMWEDMCFRQGPMMNPEHFERFLVPRYRRITDVCRKHGVDIIYLDCDGNIDVLVPLWLAAGVNGMFPLEVACGSDPVKYRREYGHDVLLLGGVNKRELSRDRAAIDAELERLRPTVEDGGFAPHIDHRCPPDIPLANYIYYLQRKVEVFGM
jgi:uroporphyrinogen decarboxylase